MANDINSICITGRLTRDVEFRTTAGGTPVLNFSIASNHSVKNQQSGQWEDRPGYFDCVILGQRAERLAQLMYKGQRVAISGSLRYRSWDGNDGKKHSRVEISADSIVLCDRRDGEQPACVPMTPQNAPQQPQMGYAAPNPNMTPNQAQAAFQQAQNVQQQMQPQPQGNYQAMGYDMNTAQAMQAQDYQMASEDIPF